MTLVKDHVKICQHFIGYIFCIFWCNLCNYICVFFETFDIITSDSVGVRNVTIENHAMNLRTLPPDDHRNSE